MRNQLTKTEINTEFILEWANMLPQFTQGRGLLRTVDDKYCCLGVACELYKQKTGNGEWVLDIGHYAFVVDGDIVDTRLPLAVRKYAGIGIEGQVSFLEEERAYAEYLYPIVFQNQETSATLTVPNDYGASFEDIKGALLSLVEEINDMEENNAQS